MEILKEIEVSKVAWYLLDSRKNKNGQQKWKGKNEAIYRQTYPKQKSP